MIQKITSIILILIIFIFAAAPAATAQTPDESSYYYIVIDQSTGTILLEQNSHNRIFPASTTKILTAFTALSNAGVTSIVTASESATGSYESGAVLMPLMEGEQMPLYDMLNALMLRSYNDVAVAIAEHIGGTVEVFSDMMNEKASEIGALDTHFVNPNGLHDEDHYTTVSDLALITRKALDNYNFASIVSRKEYVLAPTNKHAKFPTLRNSNPILGENEGMDFLVTGVKTGYTNAAKFTLVSSAHDYTGRDVVCVVANIPSRAASAELSLRLMKRAFEEFAIQSITTAGGIITDNLPIDLGYNVAAAMNIEYLMPKDTSRWDLDMEMNMISENGSSPQRGDIVGELIFKYNGKTVGSTYLTAVDNLALEPVKSTIIITDTGIENKASIPLRFLIPLLLAVVISLLFFVTLRYNKKEVEE